MSEQNYGTFTWHGIHLIQMGITPLSLEPTRMNTMVEGDPFYNVATPPFVDPHFPTYHSSGREGGEKLNLVLAGFPNLRIGTR